MGIFIATGNTLSAGVLADVFLSWGVYLCDEIYMTFREVGFNTVPSVNLCVGGKIECECVACWWWMVRYDRTARVMGKGRNQDAGTAGGRGILYSVFTGQDIY
ncbi:hypothetical protein BDW42DRAFT_171183 [Aspergillus taichungensis]|uniref:Uncharacterized protein n=1 Tax=Aspergillus taichungensis TaxID=482145 RepID=A0A2J5HSY9_9EURO|nr:hypothetical protein BDW42DRAFT_171183 [Aspergillus taichungensis]